MDMLTVGMGKQTDEMYKAHFSLWALLNSPLIAGLVRRRYFKCGLTVR